MSNGSGDGFQIIEEKTIPDIYADSVRFEINIYGVTLEFGKIQPSRPGTQGPTPHIARFRVNVSPQHAKVMAKLFSKNMRDYEQNIGKLPVPADLYKDLGLEEEW